MALSRRVRKRIMKKRGIGYLSVTILATLISWVLGRITGLDWNFKAFILDFYVYVLAGTIALDAILSLVRKIKGVDEDGNGEKEKKDNR